jgi:hypothetical protein
MESLESTLCNPHVKKVDEMSISSLELMTSSLLRVVNWLALHRPENVKMLLIISFFME